MAKWITKASLLVAALAVFAAAGCAPSNLANCHAACDSEQRCGTITDSQAQNCHTDCDSKKGSLQDQQNSTDMQCKNAGTVRSADHNCLQMDCNKIVSCLGAVDRTCVKP